MPITVTAPTGVLTPDGERTILTRLTTALLAASDATGNAFLASIIGGTVHVLDADHVFAGGAPRPLVLVDVTLPDIGLPDVASRASFITGATDIVAASTIEGHDPADTWVHIVNAPDGGWGIGGRQYRAPDLIAAIAAAAGAASDTARRGPLESPS